MLPAVRSNNLNLIRWLHNGHNNTAKILSSLINSNLLSQIATNKKDMPDDLARRIEKELSLPNGWMDRDNKSAILMGHTDFNLYFKTKNLPPAAKNSLLNFLEYSLNPTTDQKPMQ